jgi:hypothetical protein
MNWLMTVDLTEIGADDEILDSWVYEEQTPDQSMIETLCGIIREHIKSSLDMECSLSDGMGWAKKLMDYARYYDYHSIIEVQGNGKALIFEFLADN